MLRFDDGLPILLPYQQRWIEETAPVAVNEKGRRTGMSWADGAARVLHAGAGRGNVYYMAYNKDMTKSYIDDCAMWAKEFDVAAGVVQESLIEVEKRQVTRFHIEFDSGKIIEALASAPRVLRSKGRPGDVVVVDEAAFIDDLDEVLKAALAVTQWGGMVRIISTHNGDDNPFAQLVRDINEKRQSYALHSIPLDVAVAEGLARRVHSVAGLPWREGAAGEWLADTVSKYRSKDEANEELFCIPRHGGGAYLTRALVEGCMKGDAPVLRFEGSKEFNAMPEPVRNEEMKAWLGENLDPVLKDLIPENRHVLGYDFARSLDLSVIAPLEIGPMLRRRSPFLLEMSDVPHMQQLQAAKAIADGLPRFSGGCVDAGGNGSFVAEALHDKYGSAIDQVMITEGWWREWLPKYKVALQDGEIELPRSDDLVSDHRAVRMVNGVPKLPAGNTGGEGQRHGDGLVALALAWQASESDHGPIECETAGGRVGSAGADDYVGETPGGGAGRFAGY